jgi:hypothetical protein
VREERSRREWELAEGAEFGLDALFTLKWGGGEAAAEKF